MYVRKPVYTTEKLDTDPSRQERGLTGLTYLSVETDSVPIMFFEKGMDPWFFWFEAGDVYGPKGGVENSSKGVV